MAGDAGLAAIDHRDASLPALKKRNKAGIIKMIEHAVGIYIGLLLLACLVAIVSKMVTHLPYTIFLTLVGLLIGVLGIGPEIEKTGFGYHLIFFVFLPPLLPPFNCFVSFFFWIVPDKSEIFAG